MWRTAMFNKKDFEKWTKLQLHHEENAKKCAAVIATMQEHCDHSWKHVGRDSHYNYYECKICKIQDRW